MPNLYNLLPTISNQYEQVSGCAFYRYIFPNNENAGEKSDNWKPNAVYLYTDDEKNQGTKRQLSRRVMLSDTWEDDYTEYVECNATALCGGLSYRGRANKLEKAQHMNTLIFDLDNVDEDCLKNVIHRFENFDYTQIRSIPKPTFIALSGGGIHLYYVFEEPIELFPNIKLQLKKLKYDLTFRIWEYKATSLEKNIQYQSINQGFRMVGSCNKKNNEVVAFKTGDKITLEYLNDYAIHDKNKVDITKRFRPSKMSREQAKEKYPEWYQRVIVDGNKAKNKWHINKALYNWWKGKAKEIKGGHRYFYLMCLSIYAVKCDVSKKELKKDMEEVFEVLKGVEHSNKLEKKDIISALECYDKTLFNFTIDDIEKLTDIRIERNKRNYQKQSDHLEEIRMIRDIRMKRQGKKWDDNNGRKSKKNIVEEYLLKNPGARKVDVIRDTGLSKKTVYKYYDEIKNSTN